jgi:hypothetical protein
VDRNSEICVVEGGRHHSSRLAVRSDKLEQGYINCEIIGHDTIYRPPDEAKSSYSTGAVRPEVLQSRAFTRSPISFRLQIPGKNLTGVKRRSIFA